MRGVLVCLALALVPLAGCSDSDNGDDGGGTNTGGAPTTATASARPTTSRPGGGSTTDPPVGNDPPTATLSADVSSGDLPLDVTFSIDGSDPDGDELTWTLDADGDGSAETIGSELPASYLFTYEDDGNYTARLLVSDGVNQVEATLEILVTGGTPPGVVDSFSGEFATAAYGCALRRTAPGGDADGVGYLTYIANPDAIGGAFTSTITVGAGLAADLNFYFTGEDGTLIEAYTAGSAAAPVGDATFTGEVPEATYFLFWSACGGANIGVTYEVVG